MINKTEKNKDISTIKIIRKIIPMAFMACPIYFLMNIIVACFHGVSHGFNTFMTQKFFDSVSDMIGNNKALSTVLLMAIALGLSLIISQILNGVHNFMTNNLSKRVAGHVWKKIYSKSGKIDAISFENPLFLDDINKAGEGAWASIGFVIVIVMLVTFYIPYFLFMGVYLYSLNKVLAVSLVIIFIPVALTEFLRVKIFTKLADESAPIRREYEYYEKCIVDREYYKETRLLGAFGYFKDLYTLSLKLLNNKIWKAEKKSGLTELGMKMITLVGYMGVLFLLFNSLMKGEISVGAFGAVFSSIGMMFGIMEEIICRHVGEAARSIGTIKNFIRFLEVPERNGEDIEIEGSPDIVIKNISFTYPGAENQSLSDITLKVNKGESIAIVGENGAGKSTLVKTMTGLYVPSEGKVLIGGADTSKISQQSLYKNISGVFQKYQRYKMTLSENISMSSMDNNLDLDNEKEKIKDATLKADLTIDKEKFPQEYDTMLSREFDGIDLSGGQWQRVAIARGFYKAHNMIVLDEPTAAIDPVEETKIYNKFKEMSKGKTSIIVTHRLGSAKIADRIVVMDKGQIVEMGTHHELINNNGKYAEMYEAQSKWYVEDELKTS